MQVPDRRAPAPQGAEAKRRFTKNFELLQAGRLRCKNHANLVAFGVCSYCGMGTCKECTVAVGSKRYCTADAEKVLKRARVVQDTMGRSPIIVAAALLSCAEGAIAGGLGFLYLVLGLLAPSMQQNSAAASVITASFAFFKPVFAFPSGTIMALGVVVFAAGLIDIGVGFFLWKSSKAAGVFAVVLAVNSALTGGIFLPVFSVVSPLLYLLIGVAAANAGTVIAGWSRLR